MKNSKPIGVVSQDVLPPKGFGMKNKQNPEFVPLITARNIAWRQKNVKAKKKAMAQTSDILRWFWSP